MHLKSQKVIAYLEATSDITLSEAVDFVIDIIISLKNIKVYSYDSILLHNEHTINLYQIQVC